MFTLSRTIKQTKKQVLTRNSITTLLCIVKPMASSTFSQLSFNPRRAKVPDSDSGRNGNPDFRKKKLVKMTHP